MRYINATVKTLLKDCAARTPAPGGGAMAALSAAASAALVEMASSYTLGKPEYKAVARTMRVIRARAARTRILCERLLDQDIAFYRAKDMHGAVAVPLKVAASALVLLEDAVMLVGKGNKNLRSDAVLAVSLAATAFLAGLTYAQVNLKSGSSRGKRFSAQLKRLRRAVPRVKMLRQKTEATLGCSLGW